MALPTLSPIDVGTSVGNDDGCDDGNDVGDDDGCNDGRDDG